MEFNEIIENNKLLLEKSLSSSITGLINNLISNYRILEEMSTSSKFKKDYLADKSNLSSNFENYKINAYNELKNIINSLYDEYLYDEKTGLDLHDYLYNYVSFSSKYQNYNLK